MNERPLLLNLCAAIDATFEEVDAKKPFLLGAVPLTYGTLKDRMRRLQAFFEYFGLGAEDRVVIVSGDDSAVINLYFAIVRVAVIGNDETTRDEVSRLIAAAEPRMVFVDWAIMPIEAVKELVPETCHAVSIARIVPSGKRSLVSKLLGENTPDARFSAERNAFPALLDNVEPASFAFAARDAAVAHMLFTSGTTSRPKGVEITHGNLRAQLSTFLSVYGYESHPQWSPAAPYGRPDARAGGGFHLGGNRLPSRPVPNRGSTRVDDHCAPGADYAFHRGADDAIAHDAA